MLKRPFLPPGELRPHGTLAAYRRHQRLREKPCRKCLDEYNRQKAARGWGKKMTSKNTSAYTVSPSCIRPHRPVREINRQKRVFYECEVCGAFLCWQTPQTDTREKVLEMLRKK